jgi:hypothetical protein
VEDTKSRAVQETEAESRTPAADDTSALAPLLRSPAILAGAGAVIGLILGIFIGRASVSSSSASTADMPLAQAEARPHAKSKKRRAPAEEPKAPTISYRQQLGRKLPPAAKGLALARVQKREVANLVGTEATVPFQIAANDSSYVLASVVVLEGAKSANLKFQLDGKPAGASSLNEGWNLFTSPIQSGALSGTDHELALRLEAPEGGSLGVESVAVLPVTAGVDMAMGTPAVGSLIEGFSRPSRDSVWSHGLRSVVGVVLAPSAADYRLKVEAAAISKLVPLSVSVKVNGKDVGSDLAQKKVSELSWGIPAKVLQNGVNRIEFSYPQTATPSEYDTKSTDNRPLALRFHRLTIQPD